MRIGLITQLLWSRYGPLWANLVADVGAEPVLPPAELDLDDPRLAEVPGLAFRLAAAQALALADCDLLIVPELNPEVDAPRGGGQDPWVASFPEALHRTVAGLPPLIGVPAGPSERLEGLAVETMLRLNRDAAVVRRAWQRRRSALKRRAPRRLHLEPGPPGVATVGLLCQPWLATDALAAAVVGEGRRALSLHTLDPAALRLEGAKGGTSLVATDLEALGAARLFGRSGAVDALVLVVDDGVGADAWLARQIDAAVHKPLERVALGSLPEPARLIAAPEPD